MQLYMLDGIFIKITVEGANEKIIIKTLILGRQN
jgi:hypothetical protein